MTVFSVIDSEVKNLMSNLLKGDMFDAFLVRDASVQTFVKFSVDGRATSDDDEEGVSFCTWGQLKPYFYDLIKGNVKPKFIKIVFSLDYDEASKLSDNAAALFLNLSFTGDEITFTTGTAQKNFALDKTLDVIWDDYVVEFFKLNNIVSTMQ